MKKNIVLAITLVFALGVMASLVQPHHMGGASDTNKIVTVHMHADSDTGKAVKHLHEHQGCKVPCDWNHAPAVQNTRADTTPLIYWSVVQARPYALGKTPPFRPPIAFV